MKSSEFVKKLKDIATNYKTLYVMGCFGAPMNSNNKDRYCRNNDYNKKSSRRKMINAATSDTFGFDCVCLIKGVLWGWNGDKNKTYGGAKYESNDVPDIDANVMFNRCYNQSSDFSNIEVGEAVWMKGHIGVYIGDGLAVECSPKWDNDVQITACNCKKSGYNRRDWTKHGKLPYIDYTTDAKEDANKKEETTKNEVNTGGACTVEISVLKKGAKGATVKALQTLLIGYGYSCGSKGVDGDFGSSTLSAVKAYQKANGLSVDGSVGPATWNKLLGVK